MLFQEVEGLVELDTLLDWKVEKSECGMLDNIGENKLKQSAV